jgi:phosphopantothenoylcysteine decarboxylase/phosphopantothenate--cysteine ligase
MNREMWAHPATARNFAQLAADGATILGPGSGDQACGEIGDGRMLEPAELLAELIAFFAPKRLTGRRVLVTAGPTFEPIDPVRGLTNRSSGKMGFAIARAAAEAGAAVTLVAGPVALETPRRVQRIDVTTALEMHAAVMAEVAHCDVFVATAAVADWRVANIAGDKIKKVAGGGAPAFELVENPDILGSVAALARPPFCVGFAAESSNLVANASAKRKRKNVPLIVANLGPATFGRDDNALTLIDAGGAHDLPPASKLVLARQLVAEIATRIAAVPHAPAAASVAASAS